MKKKIILVVILVLLFFVGFLVYNLFLNNNPMLSGDVKNVVRITVIKDMCGLPETKILSNTESELLLNALKAVRTTTVKHPKHFESMQNDPKYAIEIAYIDGTVDKIYSTETRVKFFRFIDTKGPSGDSGYIISNIDESILQILEKFVP